MEIGSFPVNCCWITDCWQTDMSSQLNRYYAYRAEFDVPIEEKINSATILITANSRYQLWINGVIVERGPARSYPEQTSYDVLDVTNYVALGTNSVAVLVHNPGRSTGQYEHKRGAALLCYGEVKLESTKSVVIRTDQLWLSKEAEWYVPTDAMLSVQIGFQEHYDGRLEPQGWKTAPLAQLEGWKKSLPLGPPNISPYTELVPRGIPALVEDELTATEVFHGAFIPEDASMRAGNLRHKFEAARILAKTRQDAAEYAGDKWYEFKASPDGAALLTLDLGQNLPVRISIELDEPESVEAIELYYDERLSEDGKPSCSPGFERDDEGFSDYFIPTPQVKQFETFGLRGCRFITLVAYLNDDCRIKIAPRYVHYPMDVIPFTCSDETINSYYAKSQNTLSTCMLDVYVDCCTREQALWTFDACVQGMAAFYTYGDTALLRRSLKVSGDSALPSGQMRSTGPASVSYMILMDQSCEWVEACYAYTLYSGDTGFSSEIEPAAYGFLSLCEECITPEGFFVPVPGTWHWLDWANLDKRPYSLLVNTKLLAAAIAGAKLAAFCNSERLASVSNRIKNILDVSLPRFYSQTEGAFIEHLEPGSDFTDPYADSDLYPPGFPGGVLSDVQSPCSLHSNAQMLTIALADSELLTASMADGALKYLIRELGLEYNARNKFGPGWIEKLLSPLFEYGEDAAGIRMVKKWGAFWNRGGAPTWPETSDVTGEYNTGHGWGGAMNTLFGKYLLGLRPAEPGFAKFIFDPRPGDVSGCRGKVIAAKGEIKVDWRRKNDEYITANITIPDGCICVTGSHEPIVGPAEVNELLIPHQISMPTIDGGNL